MDVNALDALESESFDVIHAHQVLLHLPNPIQILQELFRVLKSGGILSLRDSASIHYYPELSMMQKYIASGMQNARSHSKDGL
jgi:ubiquinone/menaquinone biosynthesis C-methylase UbiE